MKTSLLLVAIAVVLAVGVVWAFGIGGKQVTTVVTDPVTGETTTVGALAGPDIPSPYLRWGDLALYHNRTALKTATTTPCAIQSPSSTSTLLTTSLQVTTASSTATIWVPTKSATAFATTTALAVETTLGSAALGSMMVISSSTNLILDAATTFAPNTWLVWGLEGVGLPSDTTKLNGFCQAEWMVL